MGFLQRLKSLEVQHTLNEDESGQSLSHATGRTFFGIAACAFLGTLPDLIATGGLLSVSAAALLRFLRVRRRDRSNSESQVPVLYSAASDLEEPWSRKASSALILWVPAVIFWNTAWAYLEIFGLAASIHWFVAFIVSVVPSGLYAWDALRAIVRRIRLVWRTEDPDPPIGFSLSLR